MKKPWGWEVWLSGRMQASSVSPFYSHHAFLHHCPGVAFPQQAVSLFYRRQWHLTMKVEHPNTAGAKSSMYMNYGILRSALDDSQAWRCTAAIPALRSLKQDDHWKFKASLSYKARPCLKTPNQNKQANQKNQKPEQNRTKDEEHPLDEEQTFLTLRSQHVDSISLWEHEWNIN